MSGNNNSFLFGGREFIGVIHYYDSSKEFGFILSNSFGMIGNGSNLVDSSKIFYSKNTTFNKDVIDSGLVVFKLKKNGNKSQAVSVRPFDKVADKQLAISYSIYMNFFYYTSRVRKIKYCLAHGYRREWITEKHSVDIKYCTRVCRYEILDRLSSIYRKRGAEEFVKRFEYFLENHCGGDKYQNLLQSNSTNVAKEIEILKNLFQIVDDETAVRVVYKHRFLSEYTTDKIRTQVEDKESSDTVEKVADIIEKKKVFDTYFDIKDKRQLRKRGKAEKPYLLGLLDLCPEEKASEFRILIDSQMRKSVCKYIDNRLQKDKLVDVKNFVIYYSSFADEQHVEIMQHVLDQKVADDFIDGLKIITTKYYNRSGKSDFSNTYEAFTKLNFKQKQLTISAYEKTIYDYFENVTGDVIFLNELANEAPFPETSWLENAKTIVVKKTKNVIMDLIKNKKSLYWHETEGFLKILPEHVLNTLKQHVKDDILPNGSLREISNSVQSGIIDRSDVDVKKTLEETSFESMIDKGTFFNYGIHAIFPDEADCLSIDLSEVVLNKMKGIVKEDGSIFIVSSEIPQKIEFFKWLIEKRNVREKIFDDLPCSDKLVLIENKIAVDVSLNEIERDLIFRGPNGDIHVLQNLEETPRAIANIIKSLPSSKYDDAESYIEWVKLFMYLWKQNEAFRSNNDKEQFFDLLMKNGKQLGIVDFSPFGIFVDNQSFFPERDYFKQCYDFINVLRKVSVGYHKTCVRRNDYSFETIKSPCKYIQFTEDLYQMLNESDRIFVCSVLSNTFEKVETKYLLPIDSFDITSEENIVPYLIIKYLDKKVEEANLCFIPKYDNSYIEEEFINLMKCLINMYAWSGLDLLYRVGDRDSYVTEGSEVKITFSNPINERLAMLFKRVVPGLTLNADKTELLYDGISEWGTWSTMGIHNENKTVSYKDEIIPPMIILLYYSQRTQCC